MRARLWHVGGTDSNQTYSAADRIRTGDHSVSAGLTAERSTRLSYRGTCRHTDTGLKKIPTDAP